MFWSRKVSSTEWVYPNGLSTSLPKAVQEAFLKTIPGLENAKILQYGYAVEYDYSPPLNFERSLDDQSVARALSSRADQWNEWL